MSSNGVYIISAAPDNATSSEPWVTHTLLPSTVVDILLVSNMNRKPQYHILSFNKEKYKGTLWENTLKTESYSSGTQANSKVVQYSGSTMALNCFFTVTLHQEKASSL